MNTVELSLIVGLKAAVRLAILRSRFGNSNSKPADLDESRWRTALAPTRGNQERSTSVGYDMYWKREPDEVREAYAAVEACAGYDEAVYARWSDAQRKHGSYFRLNIFGMGEYRSLMRRRGMLIDAPEPHWPQRGEFGVSEGEFAAWCDGGTESESIKAWKQASAAVAEGATDGVMPSYKFGSNDSWLVTPDEITRSLQALEAWEREQRDLYGQTWTDQLRTDDDGYWDKWIRFLYCARGYGGVVVR